MSNMNIARLFLAALLLGANVSNAQLADFSGTWLLQKRTSISGNDPANGMALKIYITQQSDSFIIRKQTIDQNGKDTIYLEAAAIGRISVSIVPMDRLKKISLEWTAIDSELTEIIQYENRTSQQMERKITFIWKLTGENTLTLNRLDENLISGEVWSMVGIYRRKAI
jgi:hypothetical protein